MARVHPGTSFPNTRVFPPVSLTAGGPWTLLTQTTQGSAPVDTAGFGDAGTGFTAATGEFRVVTTAVATDVDGWREAWVRWTIPLPTLFPGFSANEDLADFRVDLTSWPVVGSKFGVAVAVLDADVAGLAGSQGAASGLFDNTNVPNFTATEMGATGPASTTNTNGVPAAFRAQFQYRRDSGAGGMFRTLGVKIGAAWGWTATGGLSGVAMASADPATWFLHVGLFHDGAVVAAGQDIKWKVYYRRSRLGAWE